MGHLHAFSHHFYKGEARPCNKGGSVSDSRARDPGFNTQSSHIL